MKLLAVDIEVSTRKFLLRFRIASNWRTKSKPNHAANDQTANKKNEPSHIKWDCPLTYCSHTIYHSYSFTSIEKRQCINFPIFPNLHDTFDRRRSGLFGSIVEETFRRRTSDMGRPGGVSCGFHGALEKKWKWLCVGTLLLMIDSITPIQGACPQGIPFSPILVWIVPMHPTSSLASSSSFRWCLPPDTSSHANCGMKWDCLSTRQQRKYACPICSPSFLFQIYTSLQRNEHKMNMPSMDNKNNNYRNESMICIKAKLKPIVRLPSKDSGNGLNRKLPWSRWKTMIPSLLLSNDVSVP